MHDYHEVAHKPSGVLGKKLNILCHKNLATFHNIAKKIPLKEANLIVTMIFQPPHTLQVCHYFQCSQNGVFILTHSHDVTKYEVFLKASLGDFKVVLFLEFSVGAVCFFHSGCIMTPQTLTSSPELFF